jgi:hypothetical protein
MPPEGADGFSPLKESELARHSGPAFADFQDFNV